MPHFDQAFIQQLWLAVVDKLALGAILVAVGYLANLKLEDYRARQALTGDVRARKVELAGQIVEKTMEVEVAYLERTFLLIQALVDEARAGGRADLPETVLWELESAMRVAIQMGESADITPGAGQRVMDKLAPANAKVDAALKEAHRALAASRFWLGRGIHQRLMAQLSTIRGLFDQLQPTHGSFARFREEYSKVLRDRGDAESFLAHLLS